MYIVRQNWVGLFSILLLVGCATTMTKVELDAEQARLGKDFPVCCKSYEEIEYKPYSAAKNFFLMEALTEEDPVFKFGDRLSHFKAFELKPIPLPAHLEEFALDAEWVELKVSWQPVAIQSEDGGESNMVAQLLPSILMLDAEKKVIQQEHMKNGTVYQGILRKQIELKAGTKYLIIYSGGGKMVSKARRTMAIPRPTGAFAVVHYRN